MSINSTYIWLFGALGLVNCGIYILWKGTGLMFWGGLWGL